MTKGSVISFSRRSLTKMAQECLLVKQPFILILISVKAIFSNSSSSFYASWILRQKANAAFIKFGVFKPALEYYFSFMIDNSALEMH